MINSQQQVCERSYVAKRKPWQVDHGWWKAIRALYGDDGVPARWVKATGLDKSTLSKKVNQKISLSAEDAIVLSRLAGIAPPNGLLEDLHTRAIAAIEAARKAGARGDQLALVLTRFEKACIDAAKAEAAWEEGDGDRDIPPTNRPHAPRP